MGFAPSMAFRRGLLSKAMDLLLRLFALKSSSVADDFTCRHVDRDLDKFRRVGHRG